MPPSKNPPECRFAQSSSLGTADGRHTLYCKPAVLEDVRTRRRRQKPYAYLFGEIECSRVVRTVYGQSVQLNDCITAISPGKRRSPARAMGVLMRPSMIYKPPVRSYRPRGIADRNLRKAISIQASHALRSNPYARLLASNQRTSLPRQQRHGRRTPAFPAQKAYTTRLGWYARQGRRWIQTNQ